MTSPTRYVKGSWKAVCDSCGQRFLSSQLRKRWDGLMVCPKDFEVRHPQDFVRAKVDIQAVPWARPESEDYQFIPIDYGKQFYETVVTRGGVSDRYIDSSYFAEDYLINGFTTNSEVTIIVGYNRSFTDLAVTGSLFSFGLTKPITDSTTNSDSFSFSLNKSLVDSVSSGESGTIISQDYVDYTYFSGDFVGTSVTF